ncbi:S8 family peptidase [Aestuariimicrobium soli]|uniref:S8 family peptidase n=1 Tax=Aestuariimicrobium soli TaxID=2035834 RepID=UPI003EBA7699
MTTTRSPWLARAAVTGVVVSILSLQAPAAAHAEGEPLDAKLCRASAPTPAAGIPTMWHLERLHMQQAWQLTDPQGRALDGQGVTIAVIDTGVSNLNSALLDPQTITTLNFVPLEDDEKLAPRGVGDTDQGINCGHGTGVTAVIVGQPNLDPRTSYSGIAPGARVLAMRALKAEPTKQGGTQKEDPTYTIRAIDEAVKRKVDVINISQAMSYGTPEYAAAVKRAIDAGTVVVAAAGNKDQSIDGAAYPASYPGVISVGLSNPQDIAPKELAHADSRNQVTVAAPGVGVLTLRPNRPPAAGKTSVADLLANQAYVSETGTSFATPIVSGLVALMLQREPDLTPAQIRQRLVETADPPVGSVPDKSLGHGVVNPMRALTGPAVSSSGHPSSETSLEPVTPRHPAEVDRRPMWYALAAAGAALALAGAGLLIKLVVPPADRRGYRAARPDRSR